MKIDIKLPKMGADLSVNEYNSSYIRANSKTEAFLSYGIILPQAPPNPPGKTLYLKGCERVGVNYQECTYCEDKDKKVNCKVYTCDDNGNCAILWHRGSNFSFHAHVFSFSL
jgi:hypothetical protein